MSSSLSPEDQLEFLQCARYGELEDVSSLLDAGADASFADGGGNTALHLASANGHAGVVSLLLERGARYTANASGNTPLHWAALNGHAAVVEALLSRLGAEVLDVLAKNAFGKSALTDAINSGHEDLARVILSHPSADPGFQARLRRAAGGAGGAGGAGEIPGEAEEGEEGEEEGEEGAGDEWDEGAAAAGEAGGGDAEDEAEVTAALGA